LWGKDYDGQMGVCGEGGMGWKWAVKCLPGVLSQYTTCPQVRRMRRCTEVCSGQILAIDLP